MQKSFSFNGSGQNTTYRWPSKAFLALCVVLGMFQSTNAQYETGNIRFGPVTSIANGFFKTDVIWENFDPDGYTAAPFRVTVNLEGAPTSLICLDQTAMQNSVLPSLMDNGSGGQNPLSVVNGQTVDFTATQILPSEVGALSPKILFSVIVKSSPGTSLEGAFGLSSFFYIYNNIPTFESIPQGGKAAFNYPAFLQFDEVTKGTPSNACNGSLNNGIPGVTLTVLPVNQGICAPLANNQSITTNSGYYEFLLNPNLSYDIKPSKNSSNRSCGITSQDMELTRRHILIKDCLDFTWQFFAADVNQSNSISTLDVVLMSQLSQNLSTSLPSTWSPWGFIPGCQYSTYSGILNNFPTCTQTLPVLDEILHIPACNTSRRDFVGFRRGDVDGSCTDCNQFAPGTEVAQSRAVNGEIKNMKYSSFDNGQLVEYLFYAKDPKGISILSMELDLPGISDIEVVSHQLNLIRNESYSLKEDNGLRILWLDESLIGIDVDPNMPLFSIRGKKTSKYANIQLINGGDNRWVPGEGSGMDIVITPYNRETNSTMVQVVNGHALLSIDSDLIGEGFEVSIVDLSGKSIWRQSGVYVAENHSIALPELPHGVLVVSVRDSHGIQSVKVANLK